MDSSSIKARKRVIKQAKVNLLTFKMPIVPVLFSQDQLLKVYQKELERNKNRNNAKVSQLENRHRNLKKKESTKKKSKCKFCGRILSNEFALQYHLAHCSGKKKRPTKILDNKTATYS